MKKYMTKYTVLIMLISTVSMKGNGMGHIRIWDPFGDDFFDVSTRNMASPANIYDKDGFKIIEMHVPGMKLNDISVEVEGDTIEIAGSHEEKKEEEKGRSYYRKEIRAGSFARKFNFGFTIPRDKVKAELEGGVLKVSFPSNESEAVSKKKIQITEK